MYIFFSLTPVHFIEVSVPSKEIKCSCICLLGMSTLPLSMVFLLDFETVLTWYFYISFYLVLSDFNSELLLMRKCVKGERFCQRKYTILSVPCEGYSRNESCKLHLISTFFFIVMLNSTLLSVIIF